MQAGALGGKERKAFALREFVDPIKCGLKVWQTDWQDWQEQRPWN